MEQKQSRKQKRAALNKRTTLLLIAILILTPFVVYSVHFHMQTKELNAQIASLEAKISEQQSLATSYEEEIARIGTPQYYEYLARKLLGYIYEGETIMVESPKTTEAPEAPEEE